MTNRLLELQNEIAPRAYENGDDEDARLYGRATAVRALAATRAVRYQVDGSVPVVRAPSPGTAWAAGLAMLLGHRDRATLSPDEAARRAGAHFLDLLHRGAGIPVADKASLLTGGSLTAIPAMRYGPEDVERLLRERGPLWICQDDQSAALFSPRLRIVTGIDGTAAGGRGTLVDVIDPETGRQGRERLDALLSRFATGRSGRVQVIHVRPGPAEETPAAAPPHAAPAPAATPAPAAPVAGSSALDVWNAFDAADAFALAAWDAPPPALGPRYIAALQRSPAVDARPILDYIRTEAAARAARVLTVDTSSRFYRRLVDHYLKGYLAAPSAATGQAAIDAVGKTFAGPATAGDRWEDGAIRFWNRQAIPSAFRRMRPDLPAELAAATDILSRPNRAVLPYIDVPFLLGAPNTGLGFDDDWTHGGKNISQLMHWGTGVKYSHISAETMRELFFGYELWHLEGFDVFGEDSINDLISEEQGRILGTQLKAASVTTSNLQSKLNDGFREARAWVGALIRARKTDLEDWILAENPRPAKIWWTREVQIWGPHTIASMLRAGQTPDAVKRSTLVQRIVDIYALIYEADAWERAGRTIALSQMTRKLLAHEYDSILRKMAGGEGGSFVPS